MGLQRQGSGHGEGEGLDCRFGRTCQVPAAAGAELRGCPPGHPGGGRRHHGPSGGLGAGRRGAPGVPRRAEPVGGRPHGPVRQDLPHPRLLGLYPHAEDVGGRPAREHHPPDLLGTGRGEWLGGQVQGEDPQESPLRGREGLHGLRHLCGEMPPEDRGRGLRSRTRLPQGDLLPLPSGRPANSRHRRGELHLLPARQVQGLLEGLPDQRDRLRATGRDRRGRSGQHHSGHGLEALRHEESPPVRLRSSGERLHEHGIRASVQCSRPHRRQDRDARRQDRAQVGGDHPLRGQPRREPQRPLLRRVLHGGA